MKKFLYFVFALFLFFPFIVNADLQYGNGVYVSNYTTISVNDTGNNGYTIPLQQTTTIYNVNSAFIGFGLNMSYSLVKDRYYELEIGFGTTFSHFNDLANNVTIYSQNNVCVMDSFTDSTSSFPKFRFHCNDDVTGFSLYINNSSDPNALITTAAQFYYNYAFLRYAKSVQEEITGSLQETNEKLDDVNDNLTDINDSITDSNIDSDLGQSFFDDFETDDHGLSSIITIPLSTIESLTSSSCVRLSVPIPFTNSNVYLPCMTEVYQTYIPTVFNIWKAVTFGIISYFICIDIFKMVKGFKDPESDKVEVLDL